MKKGFTLIELLAVIAILAVIALIAIPSVDKSVNEGKKQMLETQKAQIIKGAKDYLTVNTDKLPSSGSTILYVGDLQEAGFLQLNIKNPETDDYVSPNAQIEVKSIGNGYKYTVLEETLNSDSSSSSDKPVIVLNGGSIQYVEIGSTFSDKGYKATSKYGADLTANVKKIIKNKSGSVVDSISTQTVTTYTIEYTVSDPNDSSLNTSIKRTVMIVDTTKPTISLTKGDYLSITASQVSSLDYDSLATATDNSGDVIHLTYRSNLSQITGSYFIIFSAIDNSGNEATKRVTVNVTDGIAFNVTNANSYSDTKDVTINFPSYDGCANQYSLDFGNTWKDVSSSVSFKLSEETIIIARVYDGTNDKVTATYTVSKFNK